jgi:type VI protein secretion system component VasK
MTGSFPLVRAAEVEDVAALDRTVFAGGCSEYAETSAVALSKNVLKLYYEDFIAQWDSFLRDVKPARLTDLSAASENFKYLLSAGSAVRWLVTAIVCKTELTRSNDSLRLGAVGYCADLTFNASSVDNPYNLQMFKKFSCPAQI